MVSMPSKHKSCWMVFALFLALHEMNARAEQPKLQCPVAIKTIELTYSHVGGQSKPQLGAIFANHAEKHVAAITFSLSQLDSAGSPHPYPDDLIYRGGLSTGKQKHFTWDLSPEAVDLHRTGELLLVRAVRYDDATEWKDDGSESCSFTVDYHAR